MLRRIEQTALVIFVWGPGKSDSAGYRKRQDIKDALRARFPNSEIYFSEDSEVRDFTQGQFNTLQDEELAHAWNADIVFALDTAKGVGEEIAQFSSFSGLAEKLVILSHERFRGSQSFAASVRQSLAIEWYSDDDFESCRLAKEICIKQVSSYALRQFCRS